MKFSHHAKIFLVGLALLCLVFCSCDKNTMNTIIPPTLAPYLQECLDTRSLALLTSVLDTPANWLVVRLLHLALRDSAKTSSLRPGPPTSTPEHKVIIISIWRSLDFWSEIARKCGLNLLDKIAAKEICYIDGLCTPAAGLSYRGEIIRLKTLTLKELSNAISTAMQTTASTKTIVVVDGVDLLLACDPDISSTDVKQMLTEIQSKVYSMAVTCAADDPLLHNMEASATPIEHEHGALIRQLAYQAKLVFQLRPLETGHSKDVNGTIRVSRGGAWQDSDRASSRELEEGEWLFHVRGDGLVKVWGRGEA